MRPPCIQANRHSPPCVLSIVAALVTVLALSALAVACAGTGDTATTMTPASNGSGAQVVMEGFAFAPALVTIKVGETVTWTNQDSASHTVVGNNQEFESDSLAKGDSFSFAFDQAGTYEYHCSIHPSMKGTVVVQ